jgi:1,4-dihydroxy-2-naphthoate octaprenyltransferase
MHEPNSTTFPNPVAKYIAATRPPFLSVTLIGCLIGLATAHVGGVPLDATKAFLTVFFALVAHAGVNVVNDYYDALSGADAANTERLFPFTGGSRFIQNEIIGLREMGLFGYALLASVIPPGLWLAFNSAPGLLLIGLAGLLIGWAYSAPPLKLMCRGIGELAIVAAWLLVSIGADFVQRGSFSLLPVLAGLPFALLVANILYINQFPDRLGDAAAGKFTLIVRLGPQRARWGYLLIALLAHGWLLYQVIAGNLPSYSALAAATLALSLKAARDLLLHASQPTELAGAIKQTILAANLHGLLLTLTLALASTGN